MSRRTLALIVGVVLTLAACSSGGDEQEASSPLTTASSTPTTTVTPADETTTSAGESQETSGTESAQPAVACDAEGAQALDLVGDGPDAFQLGEGTAGVVLLHQNDGRHCNWVTFAETLTDAGYAVVVPAMRSGDWPQPVIPAAVTHLRQEGAEHVALVGASMGGTYAIAAAPEVDPPVDLVVAISAPDFYQGSSARDAIGELELPVLFLVAEHDTGLVPEAESMLAQAQDGELFVQPGAAHGIRLLDTDPASAQLVLDALATHLQGQ